ncbi:hypothetical protein CsSME_00002437 [Camellia sinensis var. sinensis]
MERLGVIEGQLEDERNKATATIANLMAMMAKAKAGAKRAEDKWAKAAAEEEKARYAEERAIYIDGELKLDKVENAKLMAELEEAKRAQECPKTDVAKAFDVGKLKAKELYANEMLKFEN